MPSRTKSLVLTGLLLFALISGYLIIPVGASTTWTVDDDGPADFSTIQAAINAANPGDTVYVKAGTYYEHPVIDRTLTLIGEDKYTTIIDGNGTDDVVQIFNLNVAGTTISGFTVRNGSYGFMVRSNILIKGNIIENCRLGISLMYSNFVVENTIRNNNGGLLVFEGGENIIFHNNFIDNRWHAVCVEPMPLLQIHNIWDDGYPSGGNYWDNYAGVDSDGDGIGDMPYIISWDQDRYPLMNPWIPTSPTLNTTNVQIPPEPAPVHEFNPLDTVYAVGENYVANQTYPIYVVVDRVWEGGDAIPQRVPRTLENIQTNIKGKLLVSVGGDWKLQAVWNPPLIPGKYDMIIDVNNDTIYEKGIDVLCDDNIQITAGFFVVPEVPLGTLGILAIMLFVMAIKKRLFH